MEQLRIVILLCAIAAAGCAPTEPSYDKVDAVQTLRQQEQALEDYDELIELELCGHDCMVKWQKLFLAHRDLQRLIDDPNTMWNTETYDNPGCLHPADSC